MNSNNRKHTSIWAALLAPVLALGPVSIHSAPGTLANTPLFTTTSAEPNIFFMVDDSGSMDWDLLTPESALSGYAGTTGLMPVTSTSGPGYWGYLYATYATDNAYTSFGNNGYVVPAWDTLTATQKGYLPGLWRARNSDYNKQYYNPDVTYGSWSGVDNAGADYTDADPAAARIDPYNAASAIVDLTATQVNIPSRLPEETAAGDINFPFSYMPMRYWVWEDTNGNGVVDVTGGGDTQTLVEITNSNSCAGPQTPIANGCYIRTYTAEKQNFANWWTYHRRREYAMKSAVSSVISSANGVRMGIASINASSSTERLEIASMNADPGSGNKNALMDTLFSIHSWNYTPLLDAMRDSGVYFDCSGTNLFGNTNCPLETVAVAPATESAAVCQQNFLVFVTDGYYTDAGTVTTYGDADSDNSNWADGGTTYNFDEDPYQDGVSNTLADIAMHFYERDLNAATNSVSMQCGVDENPGQHMVTYTVSFGNSGAIDTTTIPDHPNRGYASNCTATTESAFTWTDPGTDAGKIDELVHAAYNGRGAYYNASDPDALSSALTNALTSISDRKGSAASVSFNSSVLNSSSVLFLGLFNSTNWSGQLLAYTLDATNGDVVTPYLWDAGAVLDAYSPSSRKILTMGSTDGVAFQWANLTTAQKNDLKTNTAGGTDNDATGMARMGFIRGDRVCESGNSGTCSYTDSVPNTFSSKEFRARASALGDIVHSSTVFVGAPELNWLDVAPFPATAGSTYSDFKAGAAASRTQVIYAGANDGMLHGFRVSDGQELIAYIPSNLFSTTTTEGLHYLTDPSYGHKYYVDQTPVISDVYIDAGSGTAWTTVLVGSERAGGRGLFALDITDPSTFSESGTIPANIVMWEFIDDNLGYTFSKPTIALLENGRWAAILSNGYNEAGSGSWDGEAKLFILYLDGGVDGTWTLNTDYRVITTGSGTTASPNGLSTPTVVDMDGDGAADRVYAGDLNGQMWAFDISGSTPGNWDVAYFQGSTPKPLFTAAANQPITVAPEVISHPSQPNNSSPSNAPNVMVMFGTGQYMATGDNSTSDTQAFYGVWDDGTKDLDTTDLVQQTFESGFTSDQRVPTDTAVVWASDFGWYINLGDASNTGERVISSALVRGDLTYFNTLIPSVNPCSLGGSSWFMAVKSENGGRPDSAAFDTDGNNVIDGDDLLDGGSLTGVSLGGTKGDATFGGPQTLANYRYDTSADSEVPSKSDVEQLDSSGVGRLSWEELAQ